MTAKSSRRLGAALIGAALLSTAVQGADGPPLTPQTVIARADGVTLSVADLEASLNALNPPQRQRILSDPKQLAGAIESSLGRRLLLASARKAGWDRRPAVVSAIAQATAEIIISSYLKAKTEPSADYPSETESRSVYQENLGQFMQPRQYHLAQIFISLPDHADATAIAAATAKARELAQAARAPDADFAVLAKSRSDDKASAARGGDLGWLAETALIPQVAVAVQGMTDGSVSDPIQAGDGWHILREIATRPAAPRPFNDVKPEIDTFLRRQQAQLSGEQLVDQLLSEHNTQINEKVLSRLVAGAP